MRSQTSPPLAHELQASYDELCRALALLSENELAEGKLENGWSPKALLAHIAFWDQLQGQRIALLQQGRSPAEVMQSPNEGNDERALQDASRPWPEVVTQADSARQELLQLLSTLSNDALERQYQDRERVVSSRALLQHIVRHTYGHAHEVVAFCGSMQRWQRADLRRHFVEQYGNLMDSLSGLDEQTILTAQVCGQWSIRDVLAHVLSWNEFALECLKGWPRPAPQSLAEWSFTNEQEMYALNDQLLAARAHLDIIAIADGLVTVHRRILKRFDRVTEQELSSWGDIGWSQKRTLSGFLYEWSLHDLEHAEQIWRYRAGNSVDGRR